MAPAMKGREKSPEAARSTRLQWNGVPKQPWLARQVPEGDGENVVRWLINRPDRDNLDSAGITATKKEAIGA